MCRRKYSLTVSNLGIRISQDTYFLVLEGPVFMLSFLPCWTWGLPHEVKATDPLAHFT